ncbi:MAG: alpha/beta hydrolase [Sandaracinobacter sp.]
MKALSVLLALLATAPAAAQAPAPPKRYELPSTEVHRIEAKALGRAYDIAVWLPPSYAYAPDRKYPVLFTTDMPQSLPLILGLHRRLRASEQGLEDAIIVGLGYAVGDTGEYSRRRDYTPTPHGDIDAVSDMPGRPVAYGEAEGYRLHLRDELFPFLENRYRIDPTRRIYAGHSYGGLFGTHVMLTEPTMFEKYILMSPSLWYGRRLMIARERGYATRHKDLPAQAYFMIGGEETVPDPDILPFGNSRMAMVEDMDELTAMLKSRGYPSLKVQSRVFPGENHGSVYPDAIRAGMEWALKGKGKRAHIPCEVPGCRMPWAPGGRPPADE